MPIFADTGYWIALLFVEDDVRIQALALRRRYALRRIVTTDLVLVEFLNHCSKRGNYYRAGAVALVRGLIAADLVEIVPQTPELFTEALDLYANRPDKDWSLTDCASFALCYERGILEAFAYDRHFAQAGITPLLRDAEPIG